MPVIPLAEGSQVEVPGNPVQIRNPEAAGMGGQAIAHFGDTLTRVGENLDAVARHAAAESAKIQAATASAQYGTDLLKEQAKSNAAAPISDDTDGTKAIDDYTSRATKLRDEYANTLPAAARAQFIQESQREIMMTAREVYGNEIKKRAQDTKIQMGEATDAIATQARAEPLNAPDLMAKAEILINNSSTVAPRDKDATIRASKQNIARAAANGLADAAQTGKDPQGWKKAQIYLMTPMEKGGAGELFDEKDKEKMIEDMQRREASYNTNENQALDRKRKLDEEHAKDKAKSLTSEFSASLMLAGNDYNKRAPIISQIDLAVARGDLNDSQRKALTDPTAFTKEQDQRFEQDIRGKVVRGELNSLQAADKVKAAAGQSISFDAANKLFSSLQGVKENEDRTGSRIFQQVAQSSNVFKSEDVVSPSATPLEAASQVQKLNQARDDFHQQMLADPKQDMAAALHKSMSKFFGDTGVADLNPGAGPQDIDKILKEESAAILDKDSKGLLTQEQKVAAVNRAQSLLLQKKMMILEQQAQKNNSTPARGQ